MVPLGKMRGESSGNNFLGYHIASKSMEFLAESWLLPQEDMSLMLGGDGRGAGGHRPGWGGRCTHSPWWAGVVRRLQNAEPPCRVPVSHHAVPRATGPGRRERPEPDSLEPACQQGYRPQKKEGNLKSKPGVGNSSPRSVMNENALRMYGHGNKRFFMKIRVF